MNEKSLHIKNQITKVCNLHSKLSFKKQMKIRIMAVTILLVFCITFSQQSAIKTLSECYFFLILECLCDITDQCDS